MSERPTEHLRHCRSGDAAPLPAFRYRITADADPSVLARVLGLFVLRDVLPTRVAAVAIPSAQVGQTIEIDVSGLDLKMARHLEIRIGQFPAVTGVMMRPRVRVAATAEAA
jgi:hypothetical protein